MDPEGAQGNMLICNPSSSFATSVCYCATSTTGPSPTEGEPGTTNKTKKKRSKPKQKNLSKKHETVLKLTENNYKPSSTESVKNIIEDRKTVADNTTDITDFANLQITAEEQKKPKKARKRKKTPNHKEKVEIEPFSNTNLRFTEKMSEKKFEGLEGKQLTELQKVLEALEKKYQQQDEPYFPDKKSCGKKKTPKKNSSSEEFEEYMTSTEVERGLKDKSMVAGAIRINPRCYKEAFISSEGDEKDILIDGLGNRNRALEGDNVVVLINSVEDWKEKSGQRTAKVVYIQEEFHSRTCIGKLPSDLKADNKTYVVFSPRDSRVPRIKIYLNDDSLPKDYLKNPKCYADVLFNAQITSWKNISFAEGKIIEEVGKCGDVEVETMAILLENNLDPHPINPVYNIFFPRPPYTIPSDEITKRADLRKDCIFTIDPATAKDLDDAVSAKRLENGNILVGVHISDVSHFLHHDTLLDQTVCKRATTIYLTQRVYHMLPVELCQLCSLTHGEDKLAFSVFFELTPDAQVVSHHFARSVIHSCTKLSYEHAQMVIDNPGKEFDEREFPEILNGFTVVDIVSTIQELYKLSLIMRKRRFDTGALRIDMPKLCFHLDPDTQNPLSSFIYENRESHRLIEEFMLLANMKVAEHIYSAFPKLAFLRHHLPPKLNMMCTLQKKLELYGINMDITNAGTLHSSMIKYSTPLNEEDQLMAWGRFIVLNNLCAKPMNRAQYFCPSDDTPEMEHYALNAPCYTHFTSPIRRYADVMVHRLLAASLNLVPPPTWSYDDSKRIAMICNRQKLAAKLAGEQSSLLFLALFLTQPVETMAAVIDVKDHSLDVIVKEFGIMLRVYTDSLPAKVEFCKEDSMPQMFIQWKSSNGPIQCVQLFSLVHVQVGRAKDGLKLAGTLLPPLS